jgi:hypothetical protein
MYSILFVCIYDMYLCIYAYYVIHICCINIIICMYVCTYCIWCMYYILCTVTYILYIHTYTQYMYNYILNYCLYILYILYVCNISYFVSGKKFQPKTNRLCPYLDTINRQVLDFDFEKLCSVSLSRINVYACLVCGKYFQGLYLKK